VKVKRPHLWIAAFSLAAVLGVAVVDTRRTSPGELAAVHGAEPDLAGRSGCSECHGGWTTSMTEACLECHAAIGGQMDVGAGLHGALGKELAGRCALCHSEHHGEGFRIVNLQSFRQAGVHDPAEFDHALVGFPMSGKHLELECSKCHAEAETAVLPKGAVRFGGLDKSCGACHEDPHQGRMKLACAECHGQQAFDRLDSLSHDASLPLVGGHGDVGCRVCHADGDAHSLEGIGGGNPPPARTCLDCHESPHRKRFVRAVAQLEHTTPAKSCVVCHEPEHESFREPIDLTPALHAGSGFAIDAPHDRAACADCHGPELGEPFRARYPGRGADACAACHEDPHGGQFDQGPFAAQGCVACHDRAHFEPHAFGPEQHARTAFELTGSHVDADCDACHALPEGGGPRVFHGTPGRCSSCHADAHGGFFDAFARKAGPVEAAAEAGDCATCHTTTSFSELPAEGFDHGRWTGFPVLGAHAQTDCETCHPRAQEPDETGRTFGRVEDRFGPFTGCVTCHDDPHRGMFDRPGSPRAADGREGCARCHVQTSFRTFPGGFDHGRWTGFPLGGVHVQIGCSACHEPEKAADGKEFVRYRPMERECVDCHGANEDPLRRRKGRKR
jgi:hypothetical protein